MTKRLPIATDVPTTRAWRLKGGRSIYVHAGYQTQLDVALRELGAKWDSGQRALKIGAAKLEAVMPLLDEQAARAAAVDAVKAEARYVTIPFEAEDIRADAKRLGGVWDRDRRQWAMPSDESLAEVNRALEQRRAALAEERRRADALETAAADQAAAQHGEQIVRESGRTATGETDTLTEVSTGRMNKHPRPHQRARALGSVVRLADGRRGLITSVKIWFTGEEWASSTCWHASTHDQAHWDFRYTLAIVEATPEESAADREAEAEEADAAELAAVMTEAAEGCTGVTDFTPAGGPQILLRYGSTAQDGGRIILDGDRAIYRHPGYYDDYLRTERIITDPALVARVRDLIERGPRTRQHKQDTFVVEIA